MVVGAGMSTTRLRKPAAREFSSIGGNSSRRSIGGDTPVGLFHRSSLDAASSSGGASSTAGSSPSTSTEMM
jgi:hypothetical protein